MNGASLYERRNGVISIEVPDSSDHWQPLIDEFVLSHGALSFRPDYGITNLYLGLSH